MKKQRWEESKKRRKKIKEKKESEERRCRCAKRRKGKQVAKRFVFPMVCGSGGSKSRLAKAAGAEPPG